MRGVAAVRNGARCVVRIAAHHGFEQMGRLVKGAFDVSGYTAGVPIDEPFDKGIDALVEDGLQRVFLSGEVVIEQRARAAHALGYGRDGQAADPVFLDGRTARQRGCRRADRRVPFVVTGASVAMTVPPCPSFTDSSLDLC